MDDETEPIAHEELLYRRVPESMGWYSPGVVLNSQAFAPRPDDLTGPSISRAKYKSIQDAAKGVRGKAYYVAVLRAGDLRQAGIQVRPDPRPGDPGHAELPDLNSANRKENRTLELQRVLAEQLCLWVEGPFRPT